MKVIDLKFFCVFFRGGIIQCSKLSGRLCQVNSSVGGLLADCKCVFGCLYLDALDGNSQGVSLSFQAGECGELDTTLDPGPRELGSHPGPVTY